VASPDRPGPAVTVEERIAREAHAWSFFQLVRALTATAPGALLPGGEGPARGENVRFRPALSLGFASSGIAGVERLEDDDGEGAPSPRWRVTVNFMGIYGPASPLPNHFTEDFIERGEDGDPARDFVDLFHHRMISLFYRAWEKYRYPLRYRRGGRDPLTRRMLSLAGLGTPGMEDGARLPLPPLLRSAGLLADNHRSAAGLECFLRVQLGLERVRVEPCAPRRARIPHAQRLALGRDGVRLGRTTVLGERIADRAGSFRIVVGPLRLAAYRRFLPGGEDLARLVRLTRLYVRDPLDFSIVLRLEASEAPALRLGAGESLPLGWASWVSPTGRDECVARVPTRAYDPLYARPAGPRAPEPEPESPPAAAPGQGPAAPAARPAVGPKSTPRITTIRRT